MGSLTEGLEIRESLLLALKNQAMVSLQLQGNELCLQAHDLGRGSQASDVTPRITDIEGFKDDFRADLQYKI